MSIAAKRQELKQSESKIRRQLNEQSDVLEKRFQTKLAKLAIVGGGLIAGYALYRALSERSEEPEKPQKRKRSNLNIAMYSVVQDILKSAIPFIMKRIEATNVTKNDSQSINRK